MKVAVLIDAWFPIVGGGQVHVAKICQILAKKFNYNIEIITSRLGMEKLKMEAKPLCFAAKNEKWRQSLSASQRKITNQNLKITRLGPAWSFENVFGRIIFLFLATLKLFFENYNLISAQAFLPAIPAKIAKFAKSTPVVLTVHGVSVNVWEELTGKFSAKVFKIIEKLILFKFKYDYQISVSADFLKYPNVNKRIAVIGNGVDWDQFEKVKVRKASPFKILFVGRLHPQKGLVYLAEAVKIVVKKYPQVYVVIVGEGPKKQGLKKYIKKIGVSKYFIFKGMIFGGELIKEYKSSHLFVLPSVYEGLPLTLLEAWAAKLPVVATKVGEVSNLIQNGVNGVLVEPANSNELAKAITFVIEDENRNKLGEEGAKIAKKYNWDEIAERIYKIFQKVIK